MKSNRDFPTPRPRQALLPAMALWLLAPLPLLAGCQGASHMTGANPGWLKATVMDVADTMVRTDYQGTGAFHVGGDPAWGVSVAFQLASRGTGASAGQTFLLGRPGAGRPATGRYALGPLTEQDGVFSGFTVYYDRSTPELSEGFTTLSGVVDIVQSSDEVVEGTFRITAVQYCRSAPADRAHDWCVGPNTIIPGAKQIEVTGSFGAAPYTAFGPDDLGIPTSP